MNNPTLWRSPVFRRFWKIAGAASVRVKVLGIVLGVIVLLSVFVTIQMQSALTGTLRDQLERQGLALAEDLSEQAGAMLLAGDIEKLQGYLAGARTHYSNEGHATPLDYILVADPAGNIITQAVIDGMAEASLERLPALPADVPASGQLQQVSLDGQPFVDVAAPLPGTSGILRMGLSQDLIQQTVGLVTWQIVSATLVMIFIGLLAAFFLTWILTRPILSLVEATGAVASGDFSRRVPRWADDEIGDLAEAFNRMTRSLEQAEQERSEREALRAGYVRGVISAQEEERRRVARELHDSTGQSLTSLLLGLRGLEEAADAETSRVRIDDLRQVVSSTLDEVHALAWQLRPGVLDDMGLIAALRSYISDYGQRYHIQVDFMARGLDERLPLELETGIYRIVQEGLTNIVRHAHARSASILIEQRNGSLRVIIEDDGTGFDPSLPGKGRQSLGLHGIRERAELFGGKLTIESQPGQGTGLFVMIPWAADSTHTSNSETTP